MNLLKCVEKSLNDPNFKVNKKMCDSMFSLLDIDGDNQITFEELFQVISKLTNN